MSEQKTTEEILASMGVTPIAPTPTTFAGFVEVFDTFRKLVLAHERECAEVVATVNHCRRNSVDWHIDYEELPTDTPLFTFPPAAIDRDSVIEECAKVCAGIGQDWPAMSDTPHPEYIAKKLRAMKSQPAALDPRDEALRIAREALENLFNSVTNIECGEVDRKLALQDARTALAAIDKVMEG